MRMRVTYFNKTGAQFYNTSRLPVLWRCYAGERWKRTLMVEAIVPAFTVYSFSWP